MANASLYVSHSGNNTTGSSWTNAYTTLAAAITASGSTGTDFWVDSTQAESNASVQTFTFKGAAATPDRVFSVTTAGSQPPVAADETAGASFTTTAANAISVQGNVYVYGCTFSAGTSGTANLSINNASSAGDVTVDTCKLILGTGTAGASSIILGVATAAVANRTKLINTTVKFTNASQGINLGGGNVTWLNTASAVDSGGTLPTTLILNYASARSINLLCDGVDLQMTGGKAITGAFSIGGYVQFVNCKVTSGYTIGVPTTPSAATVDFIVSDQSATNYNQIRQMYQGKLIPSTSVYNNATDGDTPISWAVTNTANATPQSPFECFQIVQWAAAGTYAATRIQLTSATASLTINDVWVEVSYLGASYPLSSHVTTGYSPQLPSGSATALDTASASWSVGSVGNNYDLQVPSFTTSADGYVRFTIKVGKPSLVVYIDPAVTIA